MACLVLYVSIVFSIDENGAATNGTAETSSSESENNENEAAAAAGDDDKKSKKRKKGDKSSKPRRQKKKISSKSALMRRNIRNLMGEDNLTETTKEARVSFIYWSSFVEATYQSEFLIVHEPISMASLQTRIEP